MFHLSSFLFLKHRSDFIDLSVDDDLLYPMQVEVGCEFQGALPFLLYSESRWLSDV